MANKLLVENFEIHFQAFFTRENFFINISRKITKKRKFQVYKKLKKI